DTDHPTPIPIETYFSTPHPIDTGSKILGTMTVESKNCLVGGDGFCVAARGGGWQCQNFRRIRMISLTSGAVSKVKEIITQQEPQPAGLRIGVVGGGCSGFSYSMTFESDGAQDGLGMDKVYNFDGL